MTDHAHERIAHVISGLVGMMKHGQMPAVDFADLKTMFGDGGLCVSGAGEASGENRVAAATRLALLDLQRQIRAAEEGGNAPTDTD